MSRFRVLLSSVFAVAFFVPLIDAAKVVCYYDGTSYHRDGVAKTNNITEAATLCDQLIYGYYKINSDYEIQTSFKYPYPKGVNAGLELKKINPNLKVLLSVGGPVTNKKTERCLKVVESPEKRTTLVNSIYKTIIDYNYDGADLGWQWPESFKEEDKQFMDNGIVSIFKGYFNQIKEKLHESPSFYAENFFAFVRELKAVLKPTNKMLSISSLPHVNATAYFDLNNLKEVVDQFVLHTYDYRSPLYYPKLADYSAPLHFKNASNRNPSYNVEATVSQWLSAGVPSEKLIVAIPTFGRSWETDNSIKEMVKLHAEPPYKAIDVAEPGTYTKIKGLVSYYEVCPHVVNYESNSDSNAKSDSTVLYRMADTERRLGTFCFRVPGAEQGAWISYEEPETAAIKATYIKLKKLGGAAIVDLSLDDFKGMCNGTPYPIVKAVRQNLN